MRVFVSSLFMVITLVLGACFLLPLLTTGRMAPGSWSIVFAFLLTCGTSYSQITGRVRSRLFLLEFWVAVAIAGVGALLTHSL